MAAIPFTDFGGDGRKLVFLHGNGFPPECYSLLLQQLSRQFHVLGMHSRTMWQKDVPEDLLSWRIFAQDITQFLHENSLSDAILLGHSFGGLSALRTLQNHPNLANPLVMIDPVMVSPQRLLRLWWAQMNQQQTKSRALQQGALRRRRNFDSPEQAIEAYRDKPIFSKFSAAQLAEFTRGLLAKGPDGYTLRIAPEWEAKIYETAIYKDLDIFLKLPFFRRRALVIWGTESDTLRKDAVHFLQRVNQQFEVQPIEGGSHLVPFEQPERCAELTLQFLLEQP